MFELIKYVAKQALGLTGEERMLQVGDKAPDFKVKDHTGRERSLKDFSGKALVLWFYPKASTPG